MKHFPLPVFLLLCLHPLLAQQPEGMESLRMAPRANVVTYDDEDAIEHWGYGDSPFYLSIADELQASTAEGRPCYESLYDIPKDWRGFRVFFRFKASPGYGLYVGGRFVGASHDAASVTEFDITDLVRFGKANSLALRFSGEDRGLALERSGLPQGLTGDCAILLKPQLNIQDYTLSTTFDPASQQGAYTVDAELFRTQHKGKCYLEVELWDPQGHRVDQAAKWAYFSKKTTTAATVSSTLAGVQPWSAETPRLYTLVLRLYDERKELLDVVGTRFGFRTLSERNSLVVNGKSVTLRGITLPTPLDLSSPEAVKRLRSQLVLMKANNINAVRTCGGGPADGRLYELCDELGFYVVCDANLFPQSSMQSVVAADEDYADDFSLRVRSLYGEYKNVTSIVAWSLGDCRDNGACMIGAYHLLRQLEPHRPVLFSGAQYAENTDMVAVEDASVDALKQFLGKKQNRSLLMLAFGSIEGNSLGGLRPLWQMVEDHQGIQGGFLRCPDWRSFAERPYFPELKQLYRPVDIRLVSTSIDEAEFEITNRCDFRPIADFRIDYVICSDFKPNIVAGDITLPLAPGQSKTVKVKIPKLTLYTGEQLSAQFAVRQRGHTPAVPKHTVLAEFQFLLPSENVPRQKYSSLSPQPLAVVRDSAHCTTVSNRDFSLVFDDSLGTVSSLKVSGTELLTMPLRLCFSRPPSPNDLLDPNGGRLWSRFGLTADDLDYQVVAANLKKKDDYTVSIDVMSRCSSPKFGTLFDIRQSYLVLQTGDVLVLNDVTVADQLKTIPRIGVRLGVADGLSAVEWQGRTVESYVDRSGAGRVAQVTKPRAEMTSNYDHFQHSGNRTEVNWIAVRNDSVGLYADIIDTVCQFSFQGDTLHVDYGNTGVGGARSGMYLDESVLLKDRHYAFTLHLRPYLCDESSAQDFRRIEYPRVVSSIVEMPVITKGRERSDGPLVVTIACATPKAEIRYSLDGSEPTEKSRLYVKPFPIESSVIVKARSFKKGETPSFVASEQVSYDYVVSCTFAHKPNTPYNKDAATALFDGVTGDVSDLSHGWLGFSGHDVEAVLELGKAVSLGTVSVRFAHVPDAWVFAPAACFVSVSSDGKTFSTPLSAAVGYDASSQEMNATQVQTLTVEVPAKEVRYVRVQAKPIDGIPQWHRAKGLNPWLMLDEIVVNEEIEKK